MALTPSAPPPSPRQAVDGARDVRFVIDNLPSSLFPALRRVHDLETDAQLAALRDNVAITLYVMIAMLGVTAAALAYFRQVLETVARARVTLFSVFLLVPMPVVAALAAKALKTGAEAKGMEEEDDAWDPQLAAGGGSPPSPTPPEGLESEEGSPRPRAWSQYATRAVSRRMRVAGSKAAWATVRVAASVATRLRRRVTPLSAHEASR